MWPKSPPFPASPGRWRKLFTAISARANKTTRQSICWRAFMRQRTVPCRNEVGEGEAFDNGGDDILPAGAGKDAAEFMVVHEEAEHEIVRLKADCFSFHCEHW